MIDRTARKKPALRIAKVIVICVLKKSAPKYFARGYIILRFWFVLKKKVS